MRELFLKYLMSLFCIIALGVVLSGCFKEDLPQLKLHHHQKRPLKFATLPILAPHELAKALEPLTNHIGETLGREIEIVIAHDYADLEKMRRLGRVDFGWFKPRGEVTRPLCRVIANGRGYYQGIIVCQSSGKINAISDLKGKHFAYVDRNSSSGFVYPNDVLVKAGISPLEDFREISFAGSHSKCLEGVLDGIYDGAAVSDLVLTNPKTKDRAAKEIKILAKTEFIWPNPISVNRSLNKELIDRLLKLFIDLEKDQKGKSILEKLSARLNIRHFAPLKESK